MTAPLRVRALVPQTDGRLVARRVGLRFDGEVISAVDNLAENGPLDLDHLVIPGFIDLQMNGMDDHDLWGIVDTHDLDAWSVVEASLLDQGVTSWLPTFVSSARERYAKVPPFLADLRLRTTDDARPAIPGVHLEGPFLGSAIGAHSPRAVIDSDPDWLAALVADFAGGLALMTIGAESDAAATSCAFLTAAGVTVSMGHTTPSAEQYAAMRCAGATMVTHVFNGMGGLHHRQGGLAARSLIDDGIWCTLIADGVHVEPTWISLAFRAKGDKMILVTDRVAHRRSGTTLIGGAVRRDDGTMAGSVLTMSDAIRTCVERAGVSLADAVDATTGHPAQAMGWSDRGVIASGRRADLVALDDRLAVAAVWVGGRRVR